MLGAVNIGRCTALRRLLVGGAFVLVLLGTGCGVASVSPTAGAGSIAVTLVRVVDGDTIVVDMPGGVQERVRYIGVDAPELPKEGVAGQRLAAEARAHNEALLLSGSLRLRLDVRERDDYGRLLAYVWAGDVFVNRRMVLDGFATAGRYPPNLAYQSQLMDAQDQARRAGVGIWSHTEP